MWRPSASIENLKERARILQDIRAFFAERDVLEIQVPNISLSGITDVHIESIPLSVQNEKAYLHTSPEYPLKRLLAAGMGDCYYLGSVFRNGEQGKRHNPEFTMLEWYRLNYSMFDLIDETLLFIKSMLSNSHVQRGDVQKQIMVKVLSYAQALDAITQIDIFNTSLPEIHSILQKHEIAIPLGLDDIDSSLDLLMSAVVLPEISLEEQEKFNLVCLHSYPKSQAALSELVKDVKGNQVAARFEIIVNGLEIANGYQELRDAEQLLKRFKQDNRKRQHMSKQTMPIDTKLIEAMREGLPECSGVALGVDRLLMLALDEQDIRDVIAFPIERC